MYKNNYSSDYVDILKMKCTKTCAINNYPIDDNSIYLKITDAALTYLTINDASTDYLSRTGAAATSIADSTYFNGGDIFIQGIRAGLGNYQGSSNTNTCFGKSALAATTTESFHDSAFGNKALEALTTGGNNSAFGHHALKLQSTGANCSAFGSGALATTTEEGNSGFGALALNELTIGTKNTAVGSACLKLATTGIQNTGVGNGAGQTLGTGSNNAFLGYLAGGSVGTGSYNTLVGMNSNVASGGVNNSSTALGAYTSVGSHSFSTAIGGGNGDGTGITAAGATCTANHQIMLGTAAEFVECPGTTASGSLVLYGGLTLQTTYLTAPTSNMLGYTTIPPISGSQVTLSNNTVLNLVSVPVPVGVWNVSYSVSVTVTQGGNVQTQNIVFSENTQSTIALSTTSGQIKKHSAESYATNDVYIVSNCFTFQTISAKNIYLNIESTFNGGFIANATGYVSLTRIG
jgi:hypothetical protein